MFNFIHRQICEKDFPQTATIYDFNRFNCEGIWHDFCKFYLESLELGGFDYSATSTDAGDFTIENTQNRACTENQIRQ